MKKKVNLQYFDNSWFKPKASKLKIILWLIVNAIFFRNPLNLWSGSKVVLLKLFGAEIGKNVLIKPAVNIKYPWLLKIGDHTWIGENVWIDNLTKVTIGQNVCISQGALLLTGNHNYKNPTFDLMTGNIILEEGVWIGARSVVCPHVTCYSHSILTVGSVATSDLQAYTIYQGNPAIEIRKRKITDEA